MQIGCLCRHRAGLSERPESVHSVNYNTGSELSRKWQLFLGKVMHLLGNPVATIVATTEVLCQ